MKQKEILRRRERLARELPSAAEIVRGSLLERTIRNRRGCPKCARGEGHPVSVLTVGYAGGKTGQVRPSLQDGAGLLAARSPDFIRGYYQALPPGAPEFRAA